MVVPSEAVLLEALPAVKYIEDILCELVPSWRGSEDMALESSVPWASVCRSAEERNYNYRYRTAVPSLAEGEDDEVVAVVGDSL